MTGSRWIEQNKNDRPFAAGALSFVLGLPRYYGPHYGMRSTLDWARDEFNKGWDEAQRDTR